MSYLENFVPKKFNNLSLYDKVKSTKELANEIFKQLKVKPIPVLISSLESQHLLGGVFSKNPSLYIGINDFFFDSEYAKTLINNDLELDIILPYFLVSTIVHECYHYYQFCLVNKWSDGMSLTEKEKEKAYIYLISLYAKEFHSFCKKNGILPKTKLHKEDLYVYSQSEIEANKFASIFTSKLRELDCKKNYDKYYALQEKEYFSNTYKEIKVMKYQLNLATTFIDYNNIELSNNLVCLGVDLKDLKKTINQIILFKQLESLGLNKLLDKITKK